MPNPPFLLSDEVDEALRTGKPVVALESTIISHGLPRPRNLEAARDFEALLRDQGVVPATIAVLDGVPHVGLDDAGVQRIANEDMAKSLGASMPEAAEQQAIYARVVMQKFNELGLKLSYNEQKEMASVRRNSIANTSKDAYLNQIAQFGFSDQTYQNFMYISQCYQALNDYYFGENGVNTPSDEDIQKYYEDNYITAKHILITTVDPASGETKRTDEEAKKEAQSILDRINAGEDFDTLMNQYSEDTGLSNNPNGYTFTEGQMVTEFYDGAKALAEDEVSELVKSSYGYHIIKRVKLDDSQLDNFKSDIVSAISGSMDELLQQWMDEAQVETTDLYSTITYENVYDYLPQDVQTLVTRPGEESEQSGAQPSDADQSATEQSAQ